MSSVIARYVRMCEHGHMGSPLKATESDLAVAALLDHALTVSSMSLRELSRRSGVKITRLGDVLRRGAPATTGEINSISEVLGLVGWEVVRDAQAGLNCRAKATVTEFPVSRDKNGVPDVRAALGPGYSADDDVVD